MSRSNDAGHYFQTTDALATTERKSAKAKNKYGAPIKLPSKILAVHADTLQPSSSVVYIAEAAGEIKRVNLETRKIERVFSGGEAPLTCIAICASSRTLFAGCWDKNIYAIPLEGGGKVQKLQGHTDFVKCLLVATLDGQPVLLSGSADASIIVWDIAAGGTQQLHKLKGHTKALQDLSIDPSSNQDQDKSFTLFSASSDPEIRRWHISRQSAHELPESLDRPILAHDTSIYKLHWDSEGDLWTASADKTAKHLVLSRGWEADTVLPHPDFVRDVLPIEQLGLVATACRDEEVRIWDIASGKLVCTYTGHFEEVTELVQVGPKRIASVSIDGTLRQWSLDRADMAKYQEELERAANGDVSADDVKPAKGMLTAEEEAELAELLDDDDD